MTPLLGVYCDGGAAGGLGGGPRAEGHAGVGTPDRTALANPATGIASDVGTTLRVSSVKVCVAS